MAIWLNPDNETALSLRGQSYLIKDDNRAIMDFTEAIRIKPNRALNYLFRGSAYGFISSDYSRSITDIETALRIEGSGALNSKDRAMALEVLEAIRSRQRR
jgi:tetratricopeptide (TPR) repeat protein